MRVLVVEDHVKLAEAIARGLRREGLAVDLAHDGTAALDLAGDNPYDVVVLDRDLPGVHGDIVCRALAPGPARVLMLTASSTIEDRVEGLNLGADDYLPKPFAFAELVARIRALGRRGGVGAPPVYVKGDLEVRTGPRTVTRGGTEIALSNKEFGVLEALLRADGAVLSAEALLQQVWDMNADPFTQTVRVTLSSLRRKLGKPAVIETVRGAGYRI